MFEWDNYSIHDLVALDQGDEYVNYMTITLSAFRALEKLYELKKNRDEEAVEEHWIVLYFLKKIIYTFDLLRWKYLFNDTDCLKIDKSDSGFVNFYEISQIETDLIGQSDPLFSKESSSSIKERILIHLLDKKEDPESLLAEMAYCKYREGLKKEKLFLFFNEGRLIRKDDGEGKRRNYFYFWACYDKKSNMPYVYLLDFEQDKDADSLESEQQWNEFIDVIRSEGSRAPAAGIVAMAIDQRLEHIHPKMLKRICIGPIYSKSFSVGLQDEVKDFLDRGDQGRRFVFHLTEQFVFSIGQTIIQDQRTLGEIVQRERVRERFYIPMPSDIAEYSVFNELEEQKASLIRKTVVMPYKLHQHLKDVYRGFNIISFTRSGSINGV